MCQVPSRWWRRRELNCREAFVIKGTNDHGIAYLVLYTVSRFAAGFLAASVVAILLRHHPRAEPVLFRAANPFIQLLKPISPLAWMPLLLYTVKDPKWTAILVVFMAAVWPTLATTAFGVSSLRKEYLHVAAICSSHGSSGSIEVILPGAAPTIVNGLRISFGSALVAVVPAEMLLGELGCRLSELDRVEQSRHRRRHLRHLGRRGRGRDSRFRIQQTGWPCHLSGVTHVISVKSIM